jgi:nitroreductase
MNAICGRRSVRDYKVKPIPDSIIKELLKAGAMAPSAEDTRPCRFVVIKNRDRIRELSDAVKEALGAPDVLEELAADTTMKEDVIFYGAPLLILILAESGIFRETDCALAAQNMMLRAYDLDVGSCFIGLANALRERRDILKSLGAMEQQELYCALIFGYPKEWPKPKDRKAEVINIVE